MTAPDLTPVPLPPERLAEIRSTLLGDWLAGGWRVRCVPVPDARDRSEVFLPDATAEDTVIATLPDWADPVAVFLADAHEAVPELLAEVDRLSAERDKLAHELDGASLSLWEEKQENARLRLAYRSARERAAASSETILRVVGDRESYQGWLRAAEAELARWQATFGRDALPGALDRLHQAEAEVDRLSKRVAELEAAHAPRLCTCGHSLPAHTAPEPHSCFAHGQTCTCPTYRQLPPAEAWAQLEKNIRASEAHAAEQAAAVGAEGGTS
jgi:hypothetical protein